VAGDREQGIGNRGQGIGDREQGIGDRYERAYSVHAHVLIFVVTAVQVNSSLSQNLPASAMPANNGRWNPRRWNV